MDEEGKPKYTPNGKLLKKKVPMSNGRFHDGTEQVFYWPIDANNGLAGHFKGMAQILAERGYENTLRLKAQCGKKFSNCLPGEAGCCCRCILYNEPDFVNVDSILATDAKECGFRVIFLPKFHCELNPIEQCWGYAKRLYRVLLASSLEADLKKNIVKCLEDIPLMLMRR